MAVAVFDYATWQARYPEFGAVSEQLAALLFAEAGLYLDNTDASPVADIPTRTMLLYMLTAHLAYLSGALAGTGGATAGAVGRTSSASEGSVSVSLDSGLSPGTAAWYNLSSYGLAFWMATQSLRSATYVPAPPRIFNPWRATRWLR